MFKHFFSPLLLFCFISLALAGEFYVDRVLLENVRNYYGKQAGKRMLAWQDLLVNSRGLAESEKLLRVNNFFNQLQFVSDQKHWGTEDYWATPVEFLASGAGDCEDFSIAKYFTLRQLGVADARLRITYVKALELNQAHMVLSYYPKTEREPLILDNLVSEIKPAGQRKDLQPVYNFNGDGLWLARERGKGALRIGKAGRISLWSNVRKRLKLSAEKWLGKKQPGKKTRTTP
ncbi:MAG: transglutaminase-like cysteine peptidase [Endozoicomonas sp.]